MKYSRALLVVMIAAVLAAGTGATATPAQAADPLHPTEPSVPEASPSLAAVGRSSTQTAAATADLDDSQIEIAYVEPRNAQFLP